ncbi:MAG: substrate-binding domain-containing protein [Aeromicrobium sp.]
MKITVRRHIVVLALAASGLLMATTVGACAGPDAKGASGTAGKKSDLKITIVSAPLADPFFSAMKTGTEQAAKDFGVSVTWTAPKDFSNPAADLSRLGDAALAGKPDGIVMSYFLPDAQKPALQKAAAAGIPFTFMNSGPDWEALGALNYIGEDGTIVGTSVGERFVAAGKKNVICFNHVPGVPAVQQRCDALKKVIVGAGLKFKQVEVPVADSQNPTAVGTALGGALRADPSVDAVFTLGSSSAEVASATIDKVGSKAMLATTDLSTNVLNLIKSGKIAFASDQQPYLTGYYSVQILVQYLREGVHPIGAIDTAPNWITKDNVDAVINQNTTTKGIRGAA